jgi:hypothetical protein
VLDAGCWLQYAPHGLSATSPNAECRATLPEKFLHDPGESARDGAGPASGAVAAVATGASADATLKNVRMGAGWRGTLFRVVVTCPCPRAAKDRVCGGARRMLGGVQRVERREERGGQRDGEKSEPGDSGHDTEPKDESYTVRMRREVPEVDVDVDVAKRYVCGVGSGSGDGQRWWQS